MSHKLFFVSDTNPNDTVGGGGCVCSPEKQIDCKPPFAVFPGNDMESITSPHVVVCQACATDIVARLDGEILAAGEKSTGDSVANPGFTDLPNPVSEDDVLEV